MKKGSIKKMNCFVKWETWEERVLLHLTKEKSYNEDDNEETLVFEENPSTFFHDGSNIIRRKMTLDNVSKVHFHSDTFGSYVDGVVENSLHLDGRYLDNKSPYDKIVIDLPESLEETTFVFSLMMNLEYMKEIHDTFDELKNLREFSLLDCDVRWELDCNDASAHNVIYISFILYNPNVQNTINKMYELLKNLQKD